MADRMKAFVAEAARRRVFRTAGVYLVALWGVSQGVAELGDLYGVSATVLQRIPVMGLVLLPVVIVLAWKFDINRDGISRDPQDLRRGRVEEEIANMQTIVGGELGPGGVVVRWIDAEGEKCALFVDEFFIGRSNECLVRFYDPLVSRQHAKVFYKDGAWHILDLGSRNGTMLGAERISECKLKPHNDVRVNEAGPVLRIELLEPGMPTHTAMADLPSGRLVAHVRSAALEFDPTRTN